MDLHYQLLTILFEYDNENALRELFIREVKYQKNPDFFQAALRYFSTNFSVNLSSDFCFFLDEVCKYNMDFNKDIIDTIVFTFDEITYINKSAKPVCNWFRSRSIENDFDTLFYKGIKDKTIEWLITIKHDSHFDKNCQILYDYLNNEIPKGKIAPKGIPDSLMKEFEHNN